ncbi:hypothetical protein TrVE_jg2363 [Triparma verrucosa]|nr:hypothetical protein TrVE_jg2363 [Triparma verrucosa]
MHGPTRWRSGFIHVDSLEPLSQTEGTFSANLYLKQPDDVHSYNGSLSPGTLQIWPLKYTRTQFYLNAHTLSKLTTTTSAGQMDLRQKLGSPVTVNVEPGDLCLICVQRPHAVAGFKGGSRVSLQGFVEYKRGEGLVVES